MYMCVCCIFYNTLLILIIILRFFFTQFIVYRYMFHSRNKSYKVKINKIINR